MTTFRKLDTTIPVRTRDEVGTLAKSFNEMTDELRVLEDGRLEDRFTIEDPANYSQTWETVMTYHRSPGTKVEDDVCPDRMARGESAIAGGKP